MRICGILIPAECQGDHSYIQVKKDVMNAVKALHNEGTIFLHDVKSRGPRQVFREFSNSNFIKSRYKTHYGLGALRNH